MEHQFKTQELSDSIEPSTGQLASRFLLSGVAGILLVTALDRGIYESPAWPTTHQIGVIFLTADNVGNSDSCYN
jgi:hypothetical protein